MFAQEVVRETYTMPPSFHNFLPLGLNARKAEHNSSSLSSDVSGSGLAAKNEEIARPEPVHAAHPCETSQAANPQGKIGFIFFHNSWGLINTFSIFQTLYAGGFISPVTDSPISPIESLQGSSS